MKQVKKFLLFAVLLVFYISAMSVLLQQVYLYRRAYIFLSALISHPTIEISYQEHTEGEQ